MINNFVPQVLDHDGTCSEHHRIQGFKNIYLTKKIHASWQQPLILWDQNQSHTTYNEASTVDIEH